MPGRGGRQLRGQAGRLSGELPVTGFPSVAGLPVSLSTTFG